MQTHGSARLKRFMRFDTKALLIFKRISDILASLSHEVNAIVKFSTHAITHWVWRPVDDDYSASRRRCVLGQPGHRMPPRYGLSNDRRCCIAAFSQRVRWDLICHLSVSWNLVSGPLRMSLFRSSMGRRRGRASAPTGAMAAAVADR